MLQRTYHFKLEQKFELSPSTIKPLKLSSPEISEGTMIPTNTTGSTRTQHVSRVFRNRYAAVLF